MSSFFPCVNSFQDFTSTEKPEVEIGSNRPVPVAKNVNEMIQEFPM